MKILCFFLLFVLLWSCKKSKYENQHKINYQTIENFSCKNLQDTGWLQLDTLRIDGTESSMEGFFFIADNNLCFADNTLSSIIIYDSLGTFISSKLSQGRGPEEVLGLDQITRLPNGEYCIMDAQWNIFIIDQDFKKQKAYRINWNSKKSLKQLVKNPHPEDPGLYEVEYSKNMIRPWGDKYLLFPIVSETKSINSYEGKNRELYYRENFTLGFLAIDTGIVEKLLCNYSLVYQDQKYLANFKYLLFDTYKNELIYSFEADSLMYSMHLEDSTITSFGIAGKDMDMNYKRHFSLDEASENFLIDRNKYGFYYSLHIEPQTQSVLRIYRKGEKMNNNGLQVYSHQCLIADYKTPKTFKYIGYIAPWFYAAGPIDYDTEEMIVYRFKLSRL